MSNFPRRPATGGLLLAAALVCVSAVPWSDTRAQTSSPDIGLHLIDSGGGKLRRNSCYHLDATIGHSVAGYSSAAGLSVNAGFQPATANKIRDEIFFNGFEEC